MIPPFVAPVYEPLPYELSGLTFMQLPFHTQRYLGMAKLVPPHARGLNSIHDEHTRISQSFFRSLTGNNEALVDKRHEAVAMTRELEAVVPPSAKRWYAAAQKSRLHQVFGVLLPERELLFTEYVSKFDALIWLDQQGRTNYTPEDWQGYRDARLKPVLDSATHALIAMDEGMTRYTTTTRHTWRTHHSPSFRSPCTGAHSERSNTSITHGGTEGPDSGEL
ncbi:hypothetical protein K503DRAFT_767943 [Rhizopogon vinicolor AM-OR11-026]|uniref:Uncharacterized protein n=1 Tax=Rhizopogon vinicolor AM-OR11-026 TaxID=1314800 RepID=A0A1B7N8H0_9AGAM|nr:hypothetical protein K503DRAFT_767943 [Rhizopogon vinicolor AM-OR11-026]